AGEIADPKHDTIPATWLLALSARHQTRTGGARAAQKQIQRSERDAGECRRLLVFELETQVFRVERDGPKHIGHLVPHTVNARGNCVTRVRHWRRLLCLCHEPALPFYARVSASHAYPVRHYGQ